MRNRAAASRVRGGPRSRGFSDQQCGIAKASDQRLGLSINAIRRCIGDYLTGEVAQFVSAVERMKAASFELVRASHSATDTLSGEVRFAATEGLEGQRQHLDRRQ